MQTAYKYKHLVMSSISTAVKLKINTFNLRTIAKTSYPHFFNHSGMHLNFFQQGTCMWGYVYSNEALGHSHIASGHTDCKFLLVTHSAQYWSTHHTRQTRFFTCPMYNTNTQEFFFLKRTSTYLLFNIFYNMILN